MTLQEMFDKAYLGCKSQGFERCGAPNAAGGFFCAYDGDATTPPMPGMHCAWGWVDPEGTKGNTLAGTVTALYNDQVGLAANLNYDEHRFAVLLQLAHDEGKTPSAMKDKFVQLATDVGLKIPE